MAEMIQADPSVVANYPGMKDGDPDPIVVTVRWQGDPTGQNAACVRGCSCGEPRHVVRLQRPLTARRWDGAPLSVEGPWIQCACGEWKELL